MARPMSERLEERAREVAALAAEVERLRMAIGAVRVVNGLGDLLDRQHEIDAICGLALDREEE